MDGHDFERYPNIATLWSGGIVMIMNKMVLVVGILVLVTAILVMMILIMIKMMLIVVKFVMVILVAVLFFNDDVNVIGSDDILVAIN